MDLCLGFLFCSIELFFCLCASTILYWWLLLCSIAWSGASWLLQFHSSFSGLLWLFEVFCMSIQIVKLFVLDYLFDFSPVSWGRLILLWTFPLVLLLLNPIGFGLLCFQFHSFPAYDFFFDFFCDLLVIQKFVVSPPCVCIFRSFFFFSPVVDI